MALGPIFEQPQETLAEARTKFFSQIRDGSGCPCCDRFGKVTKWSLNCSMARTLIQMYVIELSKPGWIHIVSKIDYSVHVGHYSKLCWWGLAERKTGKRDDGNPSIGLYRLSDLGKSFVLGSIRIPKHHYRYNDALFEVEDPDQETTSIREALETPFNYDELMRAR